MSLVRFDDVSLEFGDTPLLVNANFSIDAKERVCLIGRNGAGKCPSCRPEARRTRHPAMKQRAAR